MPEGLVSGSLVTDQIAGAAPGVPGESRVSRASRAGRCRARRRMSQPPDPRSFDRFARDYDRFVDLLPGHNTDWLTGMRPAGARALDAGCGSGHAVAVLARTFEEVVG